VGGCFAGHSEPTCVLRSAWSDGTVWQFHAVVAASSLHCPCVGVSVVEC
jgi:hypothetical protein